MTTIRCEPPSLGCSRAAGHEVRAYASAAEFLLARQGTLRGCLVLDVRMPGGPSGLELQKALTRQGETLPVIFLTGHGDIPMGVQAMKDGAFDFLTKPVERDALLRAVRSALAREEAARTGVRPATRSDRARLQPHSRGTRGPSAAWWKASRTSRSPPNWAVPSAP